MSKSISPAVIAVVVVVVLVVVAVIGFKMFGPAKAADNVPENVKKAYMERMAHPAGSEEMQHMNRTPPTGTR